MQNHSKISASAVRECAEKHSFEKQGGLAARLQAARRTDALPPPSYSISPSSLSLSLPLFLHLE